MGIRVTIPDDPVGAAEFTFACLGAAWFLIFAWRLCFAIETRHSSAPGRIGELEAQLSPKIRLSCHPEAEGIAKAIVGRQNPVTGAVEDEFEATYVRIRVEAVSNTTVNNCKA